MKFLTKSRLGFCGLRMKRAVLKVGNPGGALPYATGARAVNLLRTSGPTQYRLPLPRGFVMNFPFGDVVHTTEDIAFIQGRCSVFLSDDDDIAVAPPAPQVNFRIGGRAEIDFGGSITLADGRTFEAPLGCSVRVPPGGFIEFS